MIAGSGRGAVMAAFLRHDWAIARSYRLPFVLSILGFGFVMVPMFQVGKLVDRADVPLTPELAKGYFAFALVGTAVLLLGNTALQSFATELREQQATGTLEALLAAPRSPTTIIAGSALYELIQALIVLTVVFSTGLALGVRFTFRPAALGGALLALAGLVGVFAALGIGVASFTLVFKRGGGLAGLITAAVALLSGIWFPISMLPGPVQALAKLMPSTWAVNALRDALLLGDVNAAAIGGALAAAVVTVPAALWLFSYAVDRCRRTGTLGQY